jgi:hypothetical protein
MADIKALLTQAAEITKKKIAVVTQNGSIVYPEESVLDITYEEARKKVGKNCRGWNIHMSDAAEAGFFVCIGSDKYYESEVNEMIMLLLSSAFEREDPAAATLRKAVEGKYDAAELAKLEENLSAYLPGYLLLIDNFGDSREEVLEILINSLNIKLRLIYEKCDNSCC